METKLGLCWLMTVKWLMAGKSSVMPTICKPITSLKCWFSDENNTNVLYRWSRSDHGWQPLYPLPDNGRDKNGPPDMECSTSEQCFAKLKEALELDVMDLVLVAVSTGLKLPPIGFVIN